MTKHNWDELNSDKALVCRREINCEHGGATVYSVLLSDGFLLDCGTSEDRAITLAGIINRGGPELLSKTALNAARAQGPSS